MIDGGAVNRPLNIGTNMRSHYLRLPMWALALAIMVSAVVFLGGILMSDSHLKGVSSSAVRAALLCSIPFAYIRWIYARRTQLTLDDDGVTLRQPFAVWTVAWNRISSVLVTSPFDVTHRGGIAAGVRLTLDDGVVRHIPDVLSLPRSELARCISLRRSSARSASSPT